MNPFSYFAAIAAVVYAYCAFRVFLLDPREWANRVGALLNVVLALWAAASVFCYADLDRASAEFWYRAFSFCWNFFGALTLHFCLRIGGIRAPASRVRRVFDLALIYAPAVFFTLATNTFMVSGFEHRGGFWFPVFSSSAWFLAFSAYYIVYCLSALALLIRGFLLAVGCAARKRLLLMVVSISAALAGGFVTDTVFMVLRVDFPNMAILWILLWAVGMFVSMNRYSFLSPFPIRESSRIIDAMADVFLYLDEGGAVVWANASALELSGARSAAELKGRAFTSLFDGAMEDGALFGAVLAGKSPNHSAVAYFGTARLPVSAQLRSLDDGELCRGFILSARDLSGEHRLREAENRLEHTDLLLDSFIDHSLDGIVVADPDGRIVRWNNSIQTITGIPEAEARGVFVWDLLSSLAREDEQSRQFVLYLRGKLIESFNDAGSLSNQRNREIPIRDRRGRDRVLHLTSFRIPAFKGPVFAAIARDVTEERRAASETVERIKRLDHAQKMDAIGTLSGGLAHDINNALGGVVGAISLMKLGIADGTYRSCEDMRGEIDIISQASDRAAKTVKRLLALTKKRPHEFVPVRLAEAVQNVADVARHSVEPSVSVVFERPQESAIVLGDAAQLEQLTLNLVINAAHSMTVMRAAGETRGGTVTIAIRGAVPDADLRAVNSAAEDRRYWVVSVKDQGVGISAEIRGKIFDPFFTTKPPDQASGLGLAMVHSIAKQHKGFVELRSTVGFGSEFMVYLPAAEGDAAAAERPEKAGLKKGGVVLVAEDEDALRSAETAMLKALGYESVAEADGLAAVTAFSAEPGRFAAALLDMTMPGLSGDEVARRLKELRPGLPLVIASGYAQDEAVAELTRDQRTVFLQKPFTVDELGAALSFVLSK